MTDNTTNVNNANPTTTPDSSVPATDLAPDLAAAMPADSAPQPDSSGSQQNPFDFTRLAGSSSPSESHDSQVDSQPSSAPAQDDYAIDYGPSWRGSDAERTAITGLAHNAGLPADAAGKFVASVIDYYADAEKQNNQQELEALQTLWGKDFDKNMQGAAKALNRFADEMGLDSTQRQAYSRPEAFLLVHHILSRHLGEQRALGASSPATPASGANDYESFMKTPGVAEILANPLHPQYRAIADQANRALGQKVY